MKRYILIFFSLIGLQYLNAQSLISGVVKDAETKEPIQYVSVLLNTTFRGTSTNELGEFTLEIPNYSADNVFTFKIVGYKSREIDLVKFMQMDVIYLQVDEQNIEEVLVTPMDAYQLLQRAINKIPANYYSPPFAQDVFYRQHYYINNELKGLEESRYHLINTFQRPRLPRSVSVQKARGFSDLSDLDELGKFVAKNVEDDSIFVMETAEGFLNFNPDLEKLREANTSVFSVQANKYYKFDYVGMVIKNGQVMHQIAFDQKGGLKKTLYKGSMLIDTVSLAIVEFEASLSPSGIDFQKMIPLKYRLLAKVAGYSMNISALSFKVNYSKYENFWIVDGGSFNISGSVSKKKGVNVAGNMKVEYKVLRNFSKSDFYSKKSEYDRIISDIEPFRDQYFWGAHAIPPLNAQVEQSLERLLKH